MKISKKQLQHIIKETIGHFLIEDIAKYDTGDLSTGETGDDEKKTQSQAKDQQSKKVTPGVFYVINKQVIC